MQDAPNFWKQLTANLFQMNMLIKYIHNEQNSDPYSQAIANLQQLLDYKIQWGLWGFNTTQVRDGVLLCKW